jgi:dinuclear metal center YbgI/SA1388 family protein
MTKTLCVRDVVEQLMQIAPPHYAMKGDVIGLQIGSLSQPVHKVWLSLDASPEVLEAAVVASVDLLISHHALLYRPLSAVDTATRRGAALASAFAHSLTVYNAHTNLDIAPGGVNDVLADLLRLENCRVLDVHGHDEQQGEYGLGRVGNLSSTVTGQPLTLSDFAAHVKSVLQTPGVRFVGDADMPIRRVAVVGGSGSKWISHSLRAQADVLVTADCSHHDAADAWENGIALIDVTHAAMELPVLPVVRRQLETRLVGHPVQIDVARLCEDRFQWQ